MDNLQTNETNETNDVKKESIFTKSGFIPGIIIGAAVTVIVLGIAVSLFVALFISSRISNDDRAVMDKVNIIRRLVNESYLHADELTEDQLADGMYSGILESLDDPYSVYYNKEQFQDLKESTSGSFCGIGLYLSQNISTNEITVARPIPGSPGEEAGIMTGDILIRVDDEDITGQELSVVVSKVKGPADTHVKVTFLREGQEKDYDITRAKIEVDTVSYEMKDKDAAIGYIRVSEFDSVTYDQFMTALNDLKDQGMKSLIIDLRGNPGGNLDIVCKMCDELLPEGLIVYTEDNKGRREEFKSDAKQSYTGSLCVLVDGNSASASEIMTGAIKDYKLGKIIGTTTYGKGIVQRVMDLGDGTAVKITVEDYFTPNGNNIHGVGIEPDIVVEFDSEAYREKEYDNQLERALEEIKK